MTVLKDASATAIYGNRGANGVIVITTKTGKVIGGNGEGKTVFTLNGETGWQKVAHKISLLNGKDYANIINEFQPGTFNNVDLLPNTDWQNQIFHMAPIYNFEGSASGSSKPFNIMLGVGYFDQEGIIDKSSYKKTYP